MQNRHNNRNIKVKRQRVASGVDFPIAKSENWKAGRNVEEPMGRVKFSEKALPKDEHLLWNVA